MVRGGFGLFGDTFPGQVADLMARTLRNVNSFTIREGKITPGVDRQPLPNRRRANQSLFDGF